MKYILVTGGSRGIGRAICVRLAQMGLPVIINYRSDEIAARETLRLVEAQGVKAEQTCTVAEAYRWMREDLAPIERYVAKMMPNVRQWQMDALCSFAYNVGLGNLQKSTLLRLCLHGAPSDQIEKEFLKWNHAGGKVVDGLTRRRKAEGKLYTKGLYV